MNFLQGVQEPITDIKFYSYRLILIFRTGTGSSRRIKLLSSRWSSDGTDPDERGDRDLRFTLRHHVR